MKKIILTTSILVIIGMSFAIQKTLATNPKSTSNKVTSVHYVKTLSDNYGNVLVGFVRLGDINEVYINHERLNLYITNQFNVPSSSLSLYKQYLLQYLITGSSPTELQFPVECTTNYNCGIHPNGGCSSCRWRGFSSI
jgi:hypothetical protein